ncbi:MAG: vanadium-dependent haloperoxidase [Planctomycetota bacterium]
MPVNRRDESFRVRTSAAALARDREHPVHRANGDEQRLASSAYAMSFTKGLEHCSDTGLLSNPLDFVAFRRAVDEGFIDPFTDHVQPAPGKERAWEAPTAGVTFDLEGPDAQAVTMEPAPPLGSKELAYEMAEVYELALLRDLDLAQFQDGGTNADLDAALERLNDVDYEVDGRDGRRRIHVDGQITAQNAFRGSSPGVDRGPYLSQFLLVGNELPDRKGIDHGYIQYGALTIDQRVPVAAPKDYMTGFSDWLEVQDGANTRDDETLFLGDEPRRFISCPRDLATYVHDDALYEAYLNACLILLSMRTPFDPSFDQLSGMGARHSAGGSVDRAAGGFALYGGPHILTLVTEVATRALKAVRFQKFNNHIRLRPEALAGRIDRVDEICAKYPAGGALFQELSDSITDTVSAVRARNQPDGGSALLPMAFQEGSPMHPAYGAGHATVAGACVTILKAFFDTDAVFVRRGTGKGKDKVELFDRLRSGDDAVHYVSAQHGSCLQRNAGGEFLTLEGELNKLAANISIGRNMAGVHYFSDYYDSVRMGEQIAIQMLEEQALAYTTDPFVLSVPTFDGPVVRIGAR